MYEFMDYFDGELRDTPYSAPGEELEDCLRLLDMILESVLEYRGLSRQKKLFSRGLVITEAEMSSYFEMPPYYRERDICDPVLKEAAEEAFSYIEGRVRKTADSGRRDLLRIEPLKELFSLDRTELFAVILSLAPEIDRRYERIIGFLQDDIAKRTPTLGLLFTLTARFTARDSAAEAAPIALDRKMYTCFFQREEDRDALSAGLVLYPAMRRLLLGLPDIGEETSFEICREEEAIPLFFEDSADELDRVLDGGKYAFCYLENADEAAVLHLAFHAAKARGKDLYLMNLGTHLSLSQVRQQACLAALFLKLKLSGGIVLVRYPEDSEDEAENKKRKMAERTDRWKLLEELAAFVTPETVLLFGEEKEPAELSVRAVPTLRIPDPSVGLRTEMWNHFLKGKEGILFAEDVVIPDLADCHEISYGMIRSASGLAIAAADLRDLAVIGRREILDALKQLDRVSFEGLATYVSPVYTWDDITMTESQKRVLKSACDRYRLRNRIGEAWDLKKKNAYGNGVSLLLYGPPGTGKTMAAQVVSNELGVPLYRVDISRIFSKYIGETEKNLSVLFDAASKTNVILFFDEADALFAKRTEVSTSNDKYSNSETAFLLQKVEEYDGMSILATNHYSSFDSAFVRRITYLLQMFSPDEEARYQLWKNILPAKAEVEEDVDFHFLAERFELSGSNIKSILYNAAFMAGAEGKKIGTEHIVRAMQYEFKKLGRLIERKAFGPYASYLEE